MIHKVSSLKFAYFQGRLSRHIALKKDFLYEQLALTKDFPYEQLALTNSGGGSDMNPALPDTSMKLGRYVHKHELFESFSLANQN